MESELMNSGSFFPPIEKRPPAEIRAFQDEKLREALEYLGARSPYYRNAWKGIR